MITRQVTHAARDSLLNVDGKESRTRSRPCVLDELFFSRPRRTEMRKSSLTYRERRDMRPVKVRGATDTLMSEERGMIQQRFRQRDNFTLISLFESDKQIRDVATRGRDSIFRAISLHYILSNVANNMLHVIIIFRQYKCLTSHCLETDIFLQVYLTDCQLILTYVVIFIVIIFRSIPI